MAAAYIYVTQNKQHALLASAQSWGSNEWH